MTILNRVPTPAKVPNKVKTDSEGNTGKNMDSNKVDKLDKETSLDVVITAVRITEKDDEKIVDPNEATGGIKTKTIVEKTNKRSS